MPEDAITGPAGPTPKLKRTRPHDLADDYFSFIALYKRHPTYWVEYILGLRHLGRHYERSKLRIATAVRYASNATQDTYRDWYKSIDTLVN